tara:strand:- start:266 stop:538 length:273 start_codon:yes stop_codon:yes gene_type:complete
MIFVAHVQNGYVDTLEMAGPFTSHTEAIKEVVGEDRERGFDGSETQFVFYELKGQKLDYVGYIHFEDESMGEEGQLRSGYFKSSLAKALL